MIFLLFFINFIAASISSSFRTLLENSQHKYPTVLPIEIEIHALEHESEPVVQAANQRSAQALRRLPKCVLCRPNKS